MDHIALYRLWRPQSFGDVVGQQHIIRTLHNSLKEQRFSHAYLFSGPRGTGKTSAAKILAKAVNCENGPAVEPCNRCAACERITSGTVMDVIEIDAASNRGVEEIRDIRDKAKYAPTEVRYKVYIIDEVHMLTTEAFNALLKTLEEPPLHVLFILATTEPHRLPATIISRCQRFDFRRVSLEEMTARLRYICDQERIEASDDALQYIARLSDGGMRDAVSLLDQTASYAGNQVRYQDVLDLTGGVASDQFASLADAVNRQDIGSLLQWINRMMQEGKSAERCMENVLHYYRDLLMLKLVPDAAAWTDRITDASAFLSAAESCSKERLFEIIDILSRYHSDMKYAVQPQILFEVAIMKIGSLTGALEPSASRSDSTEAVSGLAQKVQQLERKITELQQAARSVEPSSTSAVPDRRRDPAPAGRQGAEAASASSALGKLPRNIGAYAAGRTDPAFVPIRSQWSRVLQRVKEEKVTIHAWLVDGEPVSVADDSVLVAFKNVIHRQTTERPANKQLIEQVMSEVLGHPMKLVTILQKDWKESISDQPESPREELKLSPEGEPGQPQEEWIREAIQLFGEDLVVIKEE